MSDQDRVEQFGAAAEIRLTQPRQDHLQIHQASLRRADQHTERPRRLQAMRPRHRVAGTVIDQQQLRSDGLRKRERGAFAGTALHVGRAGNAELRSAFEPSWRCLQPDAAL